MWTVSRIVAMDILTGLSFMDYKIRKVPRDVLLLCMAGTVLYQAVTQNIDWMVSLGGGLTSFFILGILALGCVTMRRKKSLAFPFYPFLTVGYLFGVCIGGL